MQTIPLVYSPRDGRKLLTDDITARDYRNHFPFAVWFVNPWTGVKRDMKDVETDQDGRRILAAEMTHGEA
jgi:hypothetical protein